MENGNKLVTGLLAGAIVGAVVGILFAPKTGKQTREIVVNRAGEIRKKTGDYVGSLRQRIKRGVTEEESESSSDNHVEIVGG